MDKGRGIIYAGWLERKGTSMMTPWTTRWVVLTLDKVQHYKEDKTTLKGELVLDDTSRVIIADNDSYNNFRFAVATSTDSLEFGVSSIDERNMWLQKFVYITERKSELGAFIMRVASDTEYRNAYKWEQVVVAHSIESSSGLTPAKSQTVSTKSTNGDATKFASFVPFDSWLEVFEPEVRQAREQAAREEELRQQGHKVPESSSSMVRLRDYMVESIVTNITTVSTTKSCNLLLEGMCQLIAASERQLTRTYHACKAAEAAGVSGKAVSPEGSANAIALDEHEIPLSVQEDLLCTLGSLRALILTYRFHDPSREAQMRFTRRLAVHQLERSLSRVLKSLEELQEQEQQRLEAVVKLAQGTAAVHGLTVEGNESAPTENAAESAASPAGDNASAQDKAREARKASLRQLRAIMRPLLSREFLQLEAAPLLQDFMNKNSSSLKQLEGLAAEVTDTFGAMVQVFIEKKITDMEEAVIDQVEKFVNVISEYSEPENADGTNATAQSEEAAPVEDEMSFPATPREVMVRLAKEKAAVDRKIAKIKTEGSVMWDGTDKSLVEMVLLEQTDALYTQLQDSVRMCISGGLYALLDMAGGGLSAGAVAAHEQQAGNAAPPPAPAAPPARSGYFF
jgi:hypothetical protein